MRKWPIAMVLFIIAGVLLVLSWLVFPIYYVETEGYVDPKDTGDRDQYESFTVTEEYYLDHYQASSSSQLMFDTNEDGKADSTKSPEYNYQDKVVTTDSKTSNNYGWGGSVSQNGQPEKRNLYEYSFYVMIGSLVIAGLLLIIVPLGGFRILPGIIGKILGVILILICIVYPLILGIFLSGAYEDDATSYYKLQSGFKAKEEVKVGDSFMGAEESRSIGGVEYRYSTDINNVQTENGRYLPEDPAKRTYDPYFGSAVAAGYSHDKNTNSTKNVTSIWVDKISFGPDVGWFLAIGAIFCAIAGWALTDQNPPKEDYAQPKSRKDNFREDYNGDQYGRDQYGQGDQYGRGSGGYDDPYARQGGGNQYDDNYGRGRPPQDPYGGGGTDRGGPRLGPQ